MPVIPVADWAPDAAALGNPAALRVENVVPGPTGYKPFRRFSVGSNALDDYPRGAISALDDSLVTYTYAGDESKLYSFASSTWSDASKAGGYSTGEKERWEFVRWKDKVLATNFSDNPQCITMGASNFADVTSAFKARHIAVVRDFVVMANTTDGTDGEQIDRVRWSGFNDETSWAVSSITGADVRSLNTGGQIQRVFGGEYGVILSENSAWRMSYTGAPTWFQIDEVLPGVGAVAPGAAAQHGDSVYFLSAHGFVRLVNGAQPTYIGAGRVDNTVLQDLDTNHLHRMSAEVDPEANRVIWAYPGQSSIGGAPDTLVIYDWALDRWSTVKVGVELIWRVSGVGLTLEQLDDLSASIDALDTSLDSTRFKGNTPNLGAFNSEFKSGFFSGAPMTAVIETKEVELTPGSRTTAKAFRPLVDQGSVSGRVGVRASQSYPVEWVDASPLRPGGRMPVRASGRYHRFELTLNGEWTDVLGVSVDAADARPSGRRG